MDIKEIVRSAGMSTHPSQYICRGARLSDLNSQKLETIALAIEQNYGSQALDSFIMMVWQMEVLSATAFLINLFALEKSAWNLSEIKLTNSDQEISTETEAFVKMASGFSGEGNCDDTYLIRHDFRKSSYV